MLYLHLQLIDPHVQYFYIKAQGITLRYRSLLGADKGKKQKTETAHELVIYMKGFCDQAADELAAPRDEEHRQRRETCCNPCIRLLDDELVQSVRQ